MYCKICGIELENGTKTCPYCKAEQEEYPPKIDPRYDHSNEETIVGILVAVFVVPVIIFLYLILMMARSGL
jgi:hypothetical protein